MTTNTSRIFRLLIVADDEIERKQYCDLLGRPSSFGVCDVRQVSGGAVGLAAVTAEKFDCVLLDCNMRDMTGTEFLKAVSTDGSLPFAVVLISGTEDAAVTVEATRYGAQEHLIKDRVNATSLWRAITMAVAQAEIHQNINSLLRDRINAYAALEGEAAVRKATEIELRAANAGFDRLSKDLAKARDRAEQANRAKSRFLAGISHELRTPLNGILGYARLLQMEGGLSPSQVTRVDKMLSAGQHLLDMINRTLDLSEIEAEHVLLRPEELNVQAIAAECLDLVRPMAEAKGLKLSMSMAPATSPKVTADPTRLRQILVNLLGNATKFTSHGAVELRLRPAAEGLALRIEVADTGLGVSPAEHSLLFRDFARLDSEDTRKAEGAGLGLALSARLASLMSGRMGHDDNPGGGSVFWLELPLNIVAGSTLLTASSFDMPQLEPVRCVLALIVDDVAMNRDIAESFLRASGHTAICVEGGAEAVTAAASTDFDVILMDVRMPEMDGLEATRRIRALAGIRGQVPIVALTAQAFTEHVNECREAGMDIHLAKPFSPETLLAAVMRAIAAGRGHRANLPMSKHNTLTIIPAIGSEAPIINLKAFQRTASFLPGATTESYLQTIVELGTTLLQGLRKSATLAHISNELAETAHKLAGSAGLLGFERITSLGRRFERAVRSGSPEASALADGLSAAVEGTLQSIRDRQWTAQHIADAA